MSLRGVGFKVIEDELLCNAFILHSTDSEIGTYQRKEDLWAKIESSYNHEAVDKLKLETRSWRSLSKRWDKISAVCTLFRACMTQVDSEYESGSSEINTVSILLNDTFINN